MSRNRVTYEWDNEVIDCNGDIFDHYHEDKLDYCYPPLTTPDLGNNTMSLVLVRDEWDQWGELVDRDWAYVEDGKLPEEFSYGVKVPKRFHAEYKRWLKKVEKKDAEMKEVNNALKPLGVEVVVRAGYQCFVDIASGEQLGGAEVGRYLNSITIAEWFNRAQIAVKKNSEVAS